MLALATSSPSARLSSAPRCLPKPILWAPCRSSRSLGYPCIFLRAQKPGYLWHLSGADRRRAAEEHDREPHNPSQNETKSNRMEITLHDEAPNDIESIVKMRITHAKPLLRPCASSVPQHNTRKRSTLCARRPSSRRRAPRASNPLRRTSVRLEQPIAAIR